MMKASGEKKAIKRAQLPELSGASLAHVRGGGGGGGGSSVTSNPGGGGGPIIQD